MNIGEVASLSGLNSKIIRRYEELGIIPKAGRTLSGYRSYGASDVHVLKFVKRARELGFSMKDIRQLLGLWRNKKRPSSQVKAIAEKHIAELEKKLGEIQGLVVTLRHLTQHCHGDDRPDCPILDKLDSSG